MHGTLRFSHIPVVTFSIFILFSNLRLDAAESDEIRFFREKIEPVLRSKCFSCHSRDSKKVEGGLRLDSRSAVLRGGDSGPVINRDKIESSLLLQAIRHEGGLEMPPKTEKLPDVTIADFVKWIKNGAVDPREITDDRDASSELSEARKHWAFRPLQKPSPPKVKDADWGRMPIDAFVSEKLEKRGWSPMPIAERRDLIRRLSFDLIGLPPSPEDVQAFVHDPRHDAYEHLVDRLLSSRHYGERWATHWLDVVRFAESEGYEYDRHVPDAWRFRDYVIESLNADKPFDRFVIEQIAGDEIEPDNREFQVASIFHRLGPVRRNAGNPEIALSRNEVLTERTDIIGAAILGLTIGCARCHNHKLEPISQKDYYRLQAYFAATSENNIVLAEPSEQAEWETKTKQVKDKIDVLRNMVKNAEGAEKLRIEGMIESLEELLPVALPTIPGIRNDMKSRTAMHVLRRGVWENKGEPVGARPLSVLVEDGHPELDDQTTNPRTHLAKWLVSPTQPLTARVIVNRIWQQHFGIGIVTTANDFGLRGDRPSHPELLDWLAASLVESGWSLKSIHRQIVLSKTYQQAGNLTLQNTDEAQSQLRIQIQRQHEADPENRLLWRFARRRLSAEEVRDAMLVVSGRINLKAGGPSVIVPVDPEMVQLLYKPSQWTVTKDTHEHDRRSIYLIAKRNLRLPFLESLDAPALQSSCARREVSTHAPQALEMLNGNLSNDLARAFAERLLRESGGDQTRLIEMAFQLALNRSPSHNERQLSVRFLQEQPLSEFTLALFNLNEFFYVR